MRRRFIALITFVGGAFFLFEFVLPAQLWTPWGAQPNPLTPQLGLATNIIVVLSTMALLLGPINLVLGHGTTLLRGRKGWFESAVFMVFLVGGFLTATLKEMNTSIFATMIYNQLFDGLMASFGKTSMALLAFFLVSAAYRSFRMQSLDSAVMMISATIVLLGLVPIGGWLTHALPGWCQLPTWTRWILANPNTAVQRAVAIGTCAGAFAVGLRHWLSIGARSS